VIKADVSKSSCLIDCLFNSNVLFLIYASVNPIWTRALIRNVISG